VPNLHLIFRFSPLGKGKFLVSPTGFILASVPIRGLRSSPIKVVPTSGARSMSYVTKVGVRDHKLAI